MVVVEQSALEDLVAVAAGAGHNLGVKSDGTIVAWGRNLEGQCNVPAPNANFVAVAGSGHRFFDFGHSLGLKSDGTIVAWGCNDSGQCDVPAPNADFVAVAAGFFHSLGLKSDGTIVGWGSNSQGQCDVPAPNTDFVAVAGGGGHSLGLKSDGTIVAWGHNWAGQCDVPVQNADFVALAGGEAHSLGLKSDGTIMAWGWNNDGQCDVPAPNADFVAVAAGDKHSLGIGSDGTIVAWGYNNHGQCDVPAPNADFVTVAGGWYHSVGLKSDGTVVAWGDNGYGECNVPAPNTDLVAVAAGVYHSLGLKSDGTIVAWGSNGYGQCDVPAPNADFVAVAEGGFAGWGAAGHSLGLKSDGTIVAWGYNGNGECDVPAPNADFVAVAGGNQHSLGLKSDGTIVAWGGNGWGECDVPAPNADFVAVAGGGYGSDLDRGGHSLGLKSDGTIVAWGENWSGQCDVPAPNTDFVAVAAGSHHSLGLKSDGTIVAWGCIGDVPAPNADFVAVAGGHHYNLGLKSGGTIVAWGANWDGQCDVPAPNADFVAVEGGYNHSLGIRNPSGQSEIALSDTLFAFGPVDTGMTASDTLIVMNAGDGWLRVQEISIDHDDFSADPVSFWVGPGGDREVAVLFCPGSEGPITATMTILSNDPNHGTVEVALEGEGVLAGQIAVSDTLLAFGQVCVGSPGSEPLVVSNTGTGWLIVSEISADHSDFSANPTSLAVPPGDSRTVEVDLTPSSTGLITGTLTILSDDPEHSVIEVTLEGEGVSSSQIAVSDTLLAFGQVCIGFAFEPLPLFVASEGLCPLVVSNISTDNSDFSVYPTSFTLPPGDTQQVGVEFAPSSAGLITGTLTITSNDPDHPTLEIALEGEGLVPPEIAVSPDSLCADLLVGEMETQHITIENTGSCELVWSARAVDRAGARDARLADLTGVEILWDQLHGQDPATHTTVVNQLESRGATVTENYARIDDVLLSGYHIAWITDCSDSWWQTEVQALAAWVALGGSLLLEGDGDSSVAVFNDILAALGAGIEYSATNGTGGLTTNIHSHQTTQGVDYVHLWYPRAHLSAVTSPALPLIDDSAAIANSACGEVGFGRVVTMANDLANNFHITHGNSELFVNQVFDWLGGVARWLMVDPWSGTVPGGGSVEVSVTFDATELVGGSYSAGLQVSSNDLDDPVVCVPVHLHVTDAPDIAVSETFLAFGEVEIGAIVAETLLVWNEGTDLLTVSDASSDHADFSVDPVSFALPPEESQAVVVEFAPSTEGLITGTLTILSDDPDEGTVLVALEGTGTTGTPVEYSLYATATELGTVMLRWTVPSLTDIDGFNVYRGTSRDGPFSRANEDVIVPSTPGSFEDTDVWPETTFCYELRALLTDGSEDVVDTPLACVTTGGRLAAKLYPAHPNPLTSRTSIQFDLPDEVAPVRLAVYNVRGQLVRTIFGGRLARGRHVLTWDGRDERGLRASSGAYFIRLETSARTATQKILVLN
jgi:alpha-tubulin suppressor-like RCC1 family protein